MDKFPAIRDERLPGLYATLATYHPISFNSDRMDEGWALIAKKDFDGIDMRPLALAMCALLTIPHSSAHCERVFSIIRKNKTDFRSKLDARTLESIMVLKCQDGKDISEEDIHLAQGAAVRHCKNNK